MIVGISEPDDLVWNFDEADDLFGERNFIGYKIGDVDDSAQLSEIGADVVAMYV